MTANVSMWIRAFRLPLQRAYPRLEEAPDAADIDAGIDADLDDLLRQADERLGESGFLTRENKISRPR
jgi:hypothetical protein